MAPLTLPTDPAGFFANDASEPWCLDIIGLGYVELPLFVTSSQHGLRTIGFDTSDAHVRSLVDGTSSIKDVSNESLQVALSGGCGLSTDPENLHQADVAFVCVPNTPHGDRYPERSITEPAAGTIAYLMWTDQLMSANDVPSR